MCCTVGPRHNVVPHLTDRKASWIVAKMCPLAVLVASDHKVRGLLSSCIITQSCVTCTRHEKQRWNCPAFVASAAKPPSKALSHLQDFRSSSITNEGPCLMSRLLLKGTPHRGTPTLPQSRTTTKCCPKLLLALGQATADIKPDVNPSLSGRPTCKSQRLQSANMMCRRLNTGLATKSDVDGSTAICWQPFGQRAWNNQFRLLQLIERPPDSQVQSKKNLLQSCQCNVH